MPNHIETIVRIIATPELITQIRTEIRGDELLDGDLPNIDFDKIHPMPEFLTTMCTGANTIDGVVHKIWHKVDGKDVGLTEKEVADLTAKYGTASWYDWALENWGTKWNAYGHSNGCDEDVFSFQTAWSHPEALMLKLSEKYPEAIFVCIFADEDVGSNCGAIAYKNGKSHFENAENENEDGDNSFSFAFAMAVQHSDTACESIEEYMDDSDKEYKKMCKNAIKILDKKKKDPLIALGIDITEDATFLTKHFN